MIKHWFVTFSLASLMLAGAGCDETESTDAGTDASVLDTSTGTDTPVMIDAPIMTDTPVMTDAGNDAGEMGDGGMPLPAITNPDPHTVPASADGHDRLFGAVFAADSSFYVVGQTAAGTAAPIDWQTVVGHFGADGELDTEFGTDGWFVIDLTTGTGELARGIALQSDGKIVVSATVDDEDATDLRDKDIAVFRLDTDGALDTTFGEDGIRIADLSPGGLDGTTFRGDAAYGMALDAMDRIIVSGEAIGAERTDADWAVVRFTADGALDTAFDEDGIFTLDIGERNARGRGVSYLPVGPGIIVVSGYFDTAAAGNPIDPILFALDNSGALATSFGEGGIFTEHILAIQTEVYGVAVVGSQLATTGYGRVTGTQNDLVSLRLSADGVRDLTYGPDGADGVSLLTSFTLADNARALAALPGGGTVHVGATRTADPVPGPPSVPAQADAIVWVLDADGALDTSFDTDGWATADTAPDSVDHFWAVAVDPRGERVVAVGIGGTNPATDDDGLIYLFETP